VAVAVVAAVAVEVVGMMMMGTSFYSSAGLTAEG